MTPLTIVAIVVALLVTVVAVLVAAAVRAAGNRARWEQLDEWIAKARGADPAFAAAHKALPPMHGMSRLADMLGGWECLCGRGSWTTYGCTTGEDDLEGAAESIAIAAPVEVPLRPWAYGGWVDVDGHKLHRSCVVSAVGSQADRVCAHCGPVLAVAS